MPPEPISLRNKLSKISALWSPHIVAETEGFEFRLAKLQGEFDWHSHSETDETFIVLEGMMRIEFRDGNVDLSEVEMIVVRRGVEHRPVAADECHVMIFERSGTINTGDGPPTDKTFRNDARI